jgi:general secretion pathway protein N
MKRLALLGIAFYLLVLLIRFPPALALRWFAPQALSMQSPVGSVWRGETQAASYAGYYLGSTRWGLRPLSLLRGRLAYQIEAQAPDGFIKGVFALTPTGKVQINELSAVASMQSLAAVLPAELPVSLFQGRAQLKLDKLELAEGWPLAAQGKVDLVDLMLVTPTEPLGSYELELDGKEGEPVHGSFHDTAGALEIKGTVTLSPDRNYVLQCTAHARPNASDNLKAGVDLICPKT